MFFVRDALKLMLVTAVQLSLQRRPAVNDVFSYTLVTPHHFQRKISDTELSATGHLPPPTNLFTLG